MFRLDENTKLYSGNANPPLSIEIANHLNTKLSQRELSRFSDGEIRCEIIDHVRDDIAFIIQPTCASVNGRYASVNDNLMELLVMVDALRRQGVAKLIAIVPYYGYARQDRKPGFTRTPITSRLVADMIQTAGVNTFITVDIHAEQELGFFTIPVINISASPLLVADIWKRHARNPSELTIVSPDTGGVERARNVAKQLDNAELAIIDKRRPRANIAEVMNVIGDVEGRRCVIVDDMIDTAGTLCKAAKALKENGASYVAAYATHPVFSGAAYDNIEGSVLDEVVVTNTIPVDEIATRDSKKIRQLSMGNIISETIYRLSLRKSVSEIYTGA